jgi:phosphomannomutase
VDASIVSAIFKAYDVRGKVGTELNPEVAGRIGKAFADWLPDEGQVAVGRDMRADSLELANELIGGLLAQGRDVVDIGEVTSDMIYYAVGSLKLAGGVMVTASHNPGIYNGIKFCGKDARAVGAESGLFDIRDMVIANKFTPASNSGSLSQKEIDEGWIDHVLSFIKSDKLKPIKIAVDTGNGMAGKIFAELEPFLPFEVTELYFELDGTFPNHEANPMKFETLTELIKTIKSNKLFGGIAFDGDGDRAFLVDETGTVLAGGVMCALMSEYFLSEYPGSNIVYDARNSHSVLDVIKKSGGKPVITRVGHSYIKQTMREVDAPFGGEASGHFYFRDNWYADSGLIGAMIGLYVATISGKSLSAIREEYTLYAAIPETNFLVEDKDGAIKRIEEAFPDTKPDNLDGITLDFGDGSWLNVRPSNTESILRLNAEANSQPELDKLVTKVTDLIKNTNN